MKLFSRADASSSKTPPVATRPIAPNLNRALIDAAAVYLVQLGVRPTFFEEEIYLSAGYTNPIYAGLLRPFSDAQDVNRCEQLLQLGVNHKFFATFRSMHMNQFTCFLHFLKSPSGQEALAKMAQRDRLAKRGADLLSAQEVGTVSMLEAQINEMSNEIADYRRREEEAAYHELALLEIRARIAVHIEEIKQSNPPGGFYQPLTVPDLNRACWGKYLSATAQQLKVPVPISEKSLIEAVHTYSDVVRKRHMLDFLKIEGNTKALKAYIVEKIGQFEAAKDARAVRRFRGLLEIVGADIPVTISTSTKRKASREDPGGEDIRDVEEEFLETPDAGETAEGEAASGGEAQAEYRTRRTSTVQHGHDSKPSKNRSDHRGKKAGSARQEVNGRRG